MHWSLKKALGPFYHSINFQPWTKTNQDACRMTIGIGLSKSPQLFHLLRLHRIDRGNHRQRDGRGLGEVGEIVRNILPG